MKFLKIVTTLFCIVVLVINSYSQSYRGFGLNQKGQWELIDENGNVIGQDTYERVDPFCYGVALVVKNGKKEFIDKNGKTLSNGTITSNSEQWCTFKDFNEGYAVVQYNKNRGHWTWIDSLGNIVSNEELNHVSEFVNGLAYARKDGSPAFGYMNTKGEWVIERKYYQPNTFIGNLAIVSYQKTPNNSNVLSYFYINDKGIIIDLPEGIFPQLRTIFFENYSSLRISKLKNIDISNDILWPIVNTNNFRDIDAGLKGFINNSGEIIVPCKYETVRYFYYGRAIVREKKNSPPQIINTNGELITDKIFKSAADYRDGFSLVSYNGNMAYINTNGEILKTPSNLILSKSFHHGYAIVKDPELGYNFINTDGNLISDKYFKAVKKFGDDYAAVLVGEKWGVIDGEGRMVIEPKFLNILEFKRVY